MHPYIIRYQQQGASSNVPPNMTSGQAICYLNRLLIPRILLAIFPLLFRKKQEFHQLEQVTALTISYISLGYNTRKCSHLIQISMERRSTGLWIDNHRNSIRITRFPTTACNNPPYLREARYQTENVE